MLTARMTHSVTGIIIIEELEGPQFIIFYSVNRNL
jgi:hypothetical protein